MTKPQVGAWVKARRDARKLSIKRVVEVSGISRQTWYDLEHDKHPPSTDTQAGVALALSVEPGWYDALRAGREPSPTATEAQDAGWATRAQVQKLAAEVERLTTVVAGLGAELERLRRIGDQ